MNGLWWWHRLWQFKLNDKINILQSISLRFESIGNSSATEKPIRKRTCAIIRYYSIIICSGKFFIFFVSIIERLAAIKKNESVRLLTFSYLNSLRLAANQNLRTEFFSSRFFQKNWSIDICQSTPRQLWSRITWFGFEMFWKEKTHNAAFLEIDELINFHNLNSSSINKNWFFFKDVYSLLKLKQLD